MASTLARLSPRAFTAQEEHDAHNLLELAVSKSCIARSWFYMTFARLMVNTRMRMWFDSICDPALTASIIYNAIGILFAPSTYSRQYLGYWGLNHSWRHWGLIVTSRVRSFQQRGVGSGKKEWQQCLFPKTLLWSIRLHALSHRLLGLDIYIYTLPLQVVSVCIMARLETKTKTGRGYRGTSFLIADSVRFMRVCGEECLSMDRCRRSERGGGRGDL